ncbi:hypothetical protein [Ruegeria lacuscaerulensis]|uniref:hypothetical protein n=1 Tax=Ruegeria lacuscaerulensis TaxID=55218 RepID=UPI00147BFB51|nr:hypothetical protein [Ruegeria lacuscaerulensis]
MPEKSNNGLFWIGCTLVVWPFAALYLLGLYANTEFGKDVSLLPGFLALLLGYASVPIGFLLLAWFLIKKLTSAISDWRSSTSND